MPSKPTTAKRSIKKPNYLFPVVLVVGVVIVFSLRFAPVVREYLQLRCTASHVSDTLKSHGITLRARPCMRKFRGVIVEGKIRSESYLRRVERILEELTTEVNISLAVFCSGRIFQKTPVRVLSHE